MPGLPALPPVTRLRRLLATDVTEFLCGGDCSTQGQSGVALQQERLPANYREH